MDELSRLLSNNFTVLDLGSASSTGLAGLKPFWPSTTLVEIDAVAASATDSSQFYKRIAIRSAVGGTAGRRTFYKCKFQRNRSGGVRRQE